MGHQEPGSASSLFAHTPPADGEWHGLEDHLSSVANLARAFGQRLGAADPCFVAGLWHDLGKAHPRFQKYLEAAAEGRKASGAPHAIWGAVLLYRLLGPGSAFEEIALPIAGHHAGLKSPSLLIQDIQEALEREPEVLEEIREIAKRLPSPDRFDVPPDAPLARELRIRMILSALVDADHLDTERHFDEGSWRARAGAPSLEALWERFLADQEKLLAGASNTVVNEVRHEVYRSCLEAAGGSPGLYRLTVPTGGGKTRSGLAFALKHALENDLDRVVVAIPYTSIIDQTARVYRDILGEEAVLEHHSQVEPRSVEGQSRPEMRLRLATENWDVPLVVTTTVQLFESLFSHKPGRVRKVHRLANSVIILDEIQTLPVGLVEPTVQVLGELVRSYGASIVLSTATQPALQGTPYVSGFQDIDAQEIVPGYPGHFQTLERVDYHRFPEAMGWAELADHVAQHEQALTILNTKNDALALLDHLPSSDHTYHLSTLLCPAHRRDHLREIRESLKNDEPVRVVSTQVVEAGVDLDFPVVYRALGPLDRIVQAAGRCNREGGMEARGDVHIFIPEEGSSPRGPYRHGLGIAGQLLEEMGPEGLHDPALYERYFNQLFREQDLDSKEVQPARQRLRFRQVSRRYRLIDQDTVPVVVKYTEAARGVLDAWVNDPSRRTWAKLQQYTVSVYHHELERYTQDGWVTPVAGDLHVWNGKYDRQRGLVEGLHDTADLMW